MSTVDISRPRDGVALVTLDRPASLNAMNAALIADLSAAFATLKDDRTCRVIVLTGAGRAFCAGLDLKEGATPPAAAGLGRVQSGLVVQHAIAALVPMMRGMRQPIIAAVKEAELIIANSPFGAVGTRNISPPTQT